MLRIFLFDILCGGRRLTIAHGKYHTDQSRAHAYIYIKEPYFTSFRFPASSIVGLGLGLVVRLGTVLVSFFIAFFTFPMYVKIPKIATISSVSSVAVVTVSVLCLLSHSSGVRIPCVLLIFYDFFKVLYSSFLLRLVLALRLLLGLR